MPRRRSRLTALLLAASLLEAQACATKQKWEGGRMPRADVVAQEFSPALLDETFTLQTPAIPMPGGLRPCCAFGTGLQVELGSLPLPIVELPNVIGVTEVGPHQYDHGVVTFQQSRPGGGVLSSERNGLVYTCRGGFVDTAHLRDWADWTLFLSMLIAGHARTGVALDLPDEGGRRRVVVKPFAEERIAQYGEVPLAVPLAQWIAFQLSVWHEIATWYGWSATAFSEEASAFSPEDLYSNLLGIKAAAVLVYQGDVISEAAYNENMNDAVPGLLQALGGVSQDVGATAMRSVDGVWWDSRVRLPEKTLVRKRNMEIGPQLTPWLVARAWRPEDWNRTVAFACNGRDQALVLQNPDNFAGLPFREQATVEIEISPAVASRMQLDRPQSRTITPADFAAMIERIRLASDAELGAGSSRPERE